MCGNGGTIDKFVQQKGVDLPLIQTRCNCKSTMASEGQKILFDWMTICVFSANLIHLQKSCSCREETCAFAMYALLEAAFIVVHVCTELQYDGDIDWNSCYDQILIACWVNGMYLH